MKKIYNRELVSRIARECAEELCQERVLTAFRAFTMIGLVLVNNLKGASK